MQDERGSRQRRWTPRATPLGARAGTDPVVSLSRFTAREPSVEVAAPEGDFLILPGRDFPRVLAWCKLVDATAGVSNEGRKGRTDRSYEKVACYGYPSGTHTNSSASRNGGTYGSSNRPGSSGEEPIDRTRGRDPWARTQGPVVTQNSLGSRQIVRGAAVLGSRGCDTPGAVSGRAANRECFSFTMVPAHPR